MQAATASPPTILLVDDDPIILKMLTGFLRIIAPRYEIVALSKGSQALEYLSNQSIALVITDYNMPGLDGLQLARLAKIQQPGTHIVLISGNASLTPDSDVNSYLVKPFSLMEMEQVTDAVLASCQHGEHQSLLAV